MSTPVRSRAATTRSSLTSGRSPWLANDDSSIRSGSIVSGVAGSERV
jgi:hypothetical protein